MDVREAVKTAVDYTREMIEVIDPARAASFLDSSDVAVEETRFDDAHNKWSITIGYVNPWDRSRNGALAAMAGVPDSARDRRTKKTVSIDDVSGKVLAFEGE